MTVRTIHMPTQGFRPSKDGELAIVYEPPVVTLAFEVAESPEFPLNVGAAFCSPAEKNWSRKRGRSIAHERLRSSPLRFYSDGEVTTKANLAPILLTAFLLEYPHRWGHLDQKVTRPSRFTDRMSIPLLGPGGSFIRAVIEVNQSTAGRVVHMLNPKEAGPRHWAARVPDWSREWARGR